MHIIIIGCGRLGSGLARSLVLRGQSVSVVDKDPEAFDRLGSGFKGKSVSGIGFDREVLQQAGIEQADGLAAVTSSDETNVISARIARQVFKVPKVVARLYDPGRSDIFENLGLHTIAPVTWGINKIADLLLHPELEVTEAIGNGDVSMVSAAVTPMLVGRTAKLVTVPGEIHVVAITRGSKTFLPTSGTVFQHNDTIHFAVASASAGQLERLLSGQAGG